MRRFDLVPWKAIRAIAFIQAHGAEKRSVDMPIIRSAMLQLLSSVCSPYAATTINHLIAKEYVTLATSALAEEEPQDHPSTRKDKLNFPGSGDSEIPSDASYTSNEERLTHYVENATGTLNSLLSSAKEGSTTRQLICCYKNKIIDVPSALAISPTIEHILTTTLKQGSQEVFFVSFATRASESWETLWKAFVAHLGISKVHPLQNISFTDNQFILRVGGTNTWQAVPMEKHLDAALSHLAYWASGEKIDADTGHSHLWNALTRISYLVEQEMEIEDVREGFASVLNR